MQWSSLTVPSHGYLESQPSATEVRRYRYLQRSVMRYKLLGLGEIPQ
jgi:hypothetical protein